MSRVDHDEMLENTFLGKFRSGRNGAQYATRDDDNGYVRTRADRAALPSGIK